MAGAFFAFLLAKHSHQSLEYQYHPANVESETQNLGGKTEIVTELFPKEVVWGVDFGGPFVVKPRKGAVEEVGLEEESTEKESDWKDDTVYRPNQWLIQVVLEQKLSDIHKGSRNLSELISNSAKQNGRSLWS